MSMNYKVITADNEDLQSIHIDDDDYFFHLRLIKKKMQILSVLKIHMDVEHLPQFTK